MIYLIELIDILVGAGWSESDGDMSSRVTVWQV